MDIEELLGEKYDYFIKFARKMTRDRDIIDDLVQEAAVRMLARQKSPEIKYRKTFVTTIIYHECCTKLKKEKKHPVVELDFETVKSKEQPDNTQYAELCDLLSFALKKIPARNAKLFRENALMGYTYKELSQKYAVSVNSIKLRVYRTKEYLRKTLPASVKY